MKRKIIFEEPKELTFRVKSEDFDLMGKPDGFPTKLVTKKFANVLLAAGDSIEISIDVPKGYKIFDVVVDHITYHIWNKAKLEGKK